VSELSHKIYTNKTELPLTNIERAVSQDMRNSNTSNASVEPERNTSSSHGLLDPGPSFSESRHELPPDVPENPHISLPKEAKRYTEAVEKLTKIMNATKGMDQFPKEALKVPRTVADVESVAKSMSCAIAEFAESREKLKRNKSQLRGMVETLYNASFPFIQGSFNIVSVQPLGSKSDLE
jgi:hypothetical protein